MEEKTNKRDERGFETVYETKSRRYKFKNV